MEVFKSNYIKKLILNAGTSFHLVKMSKSLLIM